MPRALLPFNAVEPIRLVAAVVVRDVWLLVMAVLLTPGQENKGEKRRRETHTQTHTQAYIGALFRKLAALIDHRTAAAAADQYIVTTDLYRRWTLCYLTE